MLRYILLALVAMIGAAVPAQAQPGDRVRCESQNYRPNSCPAYNARDVQIVQQLGGVCRPGADWNFDGRNINVRNGCRAVFGLVRNDYGNGGNWGGNNGGNWGGNGGNGQSLVIRCESQNFRQERCPIDTRGGVQLQRQLGNTRCEQGRNWGFDRGGVWVNGGCRGEFLVGAGGGNGGGNWGGGNWGGGGGQIVECSSRNYRPARCDAPVRSGVSIDRVLGGECIQGRTWGFDQRGIWVNNGCRARFRVF